MTRPNNLKDLCDSDLKNIEEIAEAHDWGEIRHDIRQERQTRML